MEISTTLTEKNVNMRTFLSDEGLACVEAAIDNDPEYPNAKFTCYDGGNSSVSLYFSMRHVPERAEVARFIVFMSEFLEKLDGSLDAAIEALGKAGEEESE